MLEQHVFEEDGGLSASQVLEAVQSSLGELNRGESHEVYLSQPITSLIGTKHIECGREEHKITYYYKSFTGCYIGNHFWALSRGSPSAHILVPYSTDLVAVALPDALNASLESFLRDALAKNTSFEHSLLVALHDGRFAVPRRNPLHDAINERVISQLSGYLFSETRFDDTQMSMHTHDSAIIEERKYTRGVVPFMTASVERILRDSL